MLVELIDCLLGWRGLVEIYRRFSGAYCLYYQCYCLDYGGCKHF